MYIVLNKILPIVFFVLCILSHQAFATDHIVKFGGTLGFKYDPSTLNVAVGDTVTWEGNFSSHPLSSTSVPSGAITFSKKSGSSFSYHVEIAGVYNYKCDFHANSGMVGSFTAIVTSIGNENLSDLRDVFDLRQNYPNPFNPSTIIEFTLPRSELTTLKIFNALGQEVATMVSKKLKQGNQSYKFEGKNLVSGIYYYQLVAGEYREVKKMVLLK